MYLFLFVGLMLSFWWLEPPAYLIVSADIVCIGVRKIDYGICFGHCVVLAA